MWQVLEIQLLQLPQTQEQVWQVWQIRLLRHLLWSIFFSLSSGFNSSSSLHIALSCFNSSSSLHIAFSPSSPSFPCSPGLLQDMRIE